MADMTPDGYLPRVVDAQIDRYLSIFGAVEIAGTKWCGKTWTALSHARSASYVDDDYEAARADPKLLTLGERPHLIDEWQLVPTIWDAVRRSVDASRSLRGGWILTGSSTPFDSNVPESDRPKHSGAGRFGRIRMRPMTLFESGESVGAVSLRGLFEGAFEPCIAPDDTLQLVNLVCRGGWPEAVTLDVEGAQTLAREYVRMLTSEGMPRMGRNSEMAERLLASLARNLGQAATYRTIIADMFGTEENPRSLVTEQTIAGYIEALKRMYVIDEVPGWVPQTRSRKRLATKPKRYFADPSLAVAQLGMAPSGVLKDWQTFGLLFETMCMRDLLVYAEALPSVGFKPVRYYRDDTGLEVDAVIELADGRWAAIECKLSDDKVDGAVASLRRLRKKLCENTAAQVRPPEFMAVITGISKYARCVEDGIYVIPIRALAP